MNKSKEGELAPLLTPREAAGILKIEEKTLEGWRRKGIGPTFIKISGKVIRYEEHVLRHYLEEHTRTSTWDEFQMGADTSGEAGDQGSTLELRKVVKQALKEILIEDAGDLIRGDD